MPPTCHICENSRGSGFHRVVHFAWLRWNRSGNLFMVMKQGENIPSIYNENIFNVHSMGHQKLKPHKEDFKLITETQQWAAHNNIDKKGKLFVWRTLIKSKAKYACGHKWWIPVRG